MSLKKELPRFLVAGFSAVGTDLVTYLIMIDWLSKPVAKGASFILGSIVAFLINKYWTFEAKPLKVQETFAFVVLYVSTLSINVAVNHLVLYTFPLMLMLAFLMATGTSTVLNFIGMKFWVFKKEIN